MRRRIFWSTLGVATAALVLTGVLVALVGQAIVGRQTRDEMQRQAVAAEGILTDEIRERGGLGAGLATLFSPRVAGDERAPRRALEELVATGRRLLGAEFFDLAFVTADHDVVLLTEGGPDPFGLDAAALMAGEDQFRRQRIEGTSVLAYARPFGRSGQDGGFRIAVVIARETAVIDFGAVIRGMVVAILVAAALSAVAARVVSRTVARRLDGLAAAAGALADGDLTARAPVGGDDEVAAVAVTFNATAERLRDVQERERAFLMSVGHDLRTPLTTIAGYAEMLEEGGLEDAETERIAGVVSAETRRLRRLVEDLMLLARLEAREFTLDLEPVEVGAHVTELAEAFRHRAEKARVRLSVDTSPVTVIGDADRISQITANLLENALRYTPEAGAVRLTVRPGGEDAVIEVSDTGSGIDGDDLPHVYEKFYVARKYRRVRPAGSGLGLSIVKELTDALGGTVSVSSAEGGTTFRVVLPAGGPSNAPVPHPGGDGQ